MTRPATKPIVREQAPHRSPAGRITAPGAQSPPTSAATAVRPLVTLHLSGSEESRSVFELLESAGVDFRAIASRRAVPLATFGRFRFEGLEGARELVDLLRDLDAAWRVEAEKVMSDLLHAPDPRLMAEMERTRARWRERAREVLARARAASSERSTPHHVPASSGPDSPRRVSKAALKLASG
jgi:hypothetical protein